MLTCVALAPLPASSQCRGDRLAAPDVAAYELFGVAVAVHGPVAVVTFPWHLNNPICGSGAAWVYEHVGADWSPTTRLDPVTCGDYALGASVAADDDVIVVGVPGYVLPGPLYRGAAEVFRRDGAGWQAEATLVPSDSDHGGAGKSVAIDGDTIVLGDPDARVGPDGFGAGAAYVFHRDALGWVEEQKLTASDVANGDHFGLSVSMSGDRLIVGAIDDDDLGEMSGSAYVFRRTAGGWIEEAKLTASDGRLSARFGHSVSMSGDAVLIGQVEQGAPLGPGSAYVFRWDGTNWSEEAKLRGTDVDGAQFGYAVSLDCDRALVGAPTWRSTGIAQGAAYLFEHGPAGWTQVEEIADCSDDDYYFYGNAVALSANAALVGAIGDDVAGTDAGAAFALPLDPICGCGTCDNLLATIASASIDNEGVRRSLRVKAMAACRAYARSQVIAAGNVLCAIIAECNAQDGQHIQNASADSLRTCVRSLVAALDIPFDRCGRGVPPRAGPRGRR